MPVVDYEGLYEVSNIGRLKSLDKYIYTRPTLKGVKNKTLLKGKVMKAKLDRYGYPSIALSVNKQNKYVTIHRLVAKAFIPNPNNKPQVNHINGIKTDNRVENLEWCTALENIRHAKITGLRNNATLKGEKSNFNKLKEYQVNEIKRTYNKKTCNQKQLAQKYGVSVSNISQILNNKTWQK